MIGQDKFNRFIEKYPHPHKTFFNRPHWTRREMFQLGAAGLTGSFLAKRAGAAPLITSQGVSTINKAKNVIFILLTGAPSHVDSFDLKVQDGVTPKAFNPTTINGTLWPSGIFPKIGSQLDQFAIVRSVRAWALVHTLSQTWMQIGRNPAAALGNIAPNIGSIVAIEKDGQRQPSQVFPTFLALNSPQGAGSGYLNTQYAPFQVTPSTAGLRDTTNPDGQQRLNDRYTLLHTLDDPLRINSPYSEDMTNMDAFYTAAKGLTYNPVVNQAFGFSAADSMRYGNTSMGNACLVAKQVLAANQGTRFIQISYGSWDMHVDIYGTANIKGNNMFTMSKPLDDGLSALMTDLKAGGLLDDTLVVMVGEFGRTVGPLTAAGGRDHYMQQFAMFAGAGVQGGKVLGVTDSQGADVTDYGWSRQRYVRPEDIEATIYSAMGIDWTTVRYDDPFHRGFEYVPFSDQDLYGPVNELWQS